jgi:sec-independent protein translocase protein TatB
MSLSEMLFIGLLGLVIFGPKKLIEVSQEAGKTLGRLKKLSGDFRSQMKAEISSSATDRPRGQAATGAATSIDE